MTAIYNPNRFKIIPESELKKAYEEISALYNTIEELTFVLHSQTRKFFGNEDLTGTDSLAFKNILAFLRDYARFTISEEIRLPIEQYASIDLLVEHIGSVYRRNIQRYTELLNSLPYRPMQFASESLVELGLRGKDIASIVYEFQFLMTTVQQAFIEFVDKLQQSGHPAFTYLRNNVSVYIGMLSYLLPFVYQIKNLIRSNIKNIGVGKTFNEILARVYGLHMRLLRGWLIKNHNSTNLFFVDFDVTDISEVKKLYEQLLKSELITKETVLLSKQETEAIINNDELFKYVPIKADIHRTPYVLANFVTKHNLGQVVYLLLKSYVSLYLLYKQRLQNYVNYREYINEHIRRYLGDDYLDYARQLLLLEPNMLVDVMENRINIELFGETYEASTIELLLLFLIGIGYLLQDIFGIDTRDRVDLLSLDIADDTLLVTIVEAEFLQNAYSKFKEKRNREALYRLANAIKTIRETVLLYEKILNTVADTYYKDKYSEFINTYIASDITTRINVLLKLGSIVLLLLMPVLDANLLLLPIFESLYVYASLNTTLASITVADMIMRLFELPYRLIKTDAQELGYIIHDITNYIVFDDMIKIIYGIGFAGQDCVFKQTDLIVTTTNNCSLLKTLKQDRITNISGSLSHNNYISNILRDEQKMNRFMLDICQLYIVEERCILLETIQNTVDQYCLYLPKNLDEYTEWSEKTLLKYVWK